MRARVQRRSGTVTVIVAACLVGLLSFIALTIDGGLLMDQRQQVQSAADAAALAAAENLFLNWNSNLGLDPKGTAATTAQASASANGFSNITVSIPPKTGSFAGKAGYAEVTITYNQPRYFSRVFGSSSIPISARAVAQGRWNAPNAGILVLNPTGSGALTDTGGGTITVTGSPVIVNSNSAQASVASGGGVVSAPQYYIGGVPGISGNGTFIGTINNGVAPTPDPLAYLPEPDPSTMTVQSTNGLHPSGSNTVTIYPGVYQGGISVSGQASLIMAPGIYYMQGGGFSFTGQGNLTATGVMIVNAPQSNSDVININGSGAINLTPPTSGTYQGISLWQKRSSTNTISVTGNGYSTYSGTFYTANGMLNVSGNGGTPVGAQYISYNLTVNGNGNFSVNWNANQVSRQRLIGLVE